MEEQVIKKRKYTKPEKINRVWHKKDFDDRMVQCFFSVKRKYVKEANKLVEELIKKWR